jgi:hypothetical protein
MSLSKNSAVLQTIEGCLPKVDGWEIHAPSACHVSNDASTEEARANIQQLGIQSQCNRAIKPDKRNKNPAVPFRERFSITCLKTTLTIARKEMKPARPLRAPP